MFDRREWDSQTLLKTMTWIGVAVTVAVVALRLWLAPSVTDVETGLFSHNYLVIGLMLLCIVALGVLGFMAGPVRREIGGNSATGLSVAVLLTGVTMAALGVLDVLDFFHVIRIDNGVHTGGVLPLLEYAFCLLGGAALVRFGLVLLSEGVTRRGIAQWSILAPVLWSWFRLNNYEMSYASMVRLEDSFFGFLTLVLEMLFLFRFARYVSGIGRVSAASMLGHSMATAVFALSGPVVRLGMYLLGDSGAYAAYHLTGVSDFVVGIFALATGIALLFGTPLVSEMAEVSTDTEEGDVSAGSAAADLFFSVAEDEVEEDSQ